MSATEKKMPMTGEGLETDIIRRLKEGERSAFDILVERYKQMGLNIAYNLTGNLEDAGDILQEAFIKVYLNIKNFREEARFSTWFYRILVNCGLDFLRKRKKSDKVIVQHLPGEGNKEFEIPDARYSPEKAVINEELAKNLEVCLESLSEKQRLCFVLKHQNGFSNQQIAESLKCRPATVKVHLFRATRALQEKLAGLKEAQDA